MRALKVDGHGSQQRKAKFAGEFILLRYLGAYKPQTDFPRMDATPF